MTGTAGDSDFSRDWEAVRAQTEIQFAPVELPENPPPPDWLQRFIEWLGNLFTPLGKTLVGVWPVLFWVLVGLAAALVLYILVRLFAPDYLGRRKRERAEDAWTPESGAALALLEEADKLADAGRYDEATHLLLQRSVGQIAELQPGLVDPSSTAREIAALSALPEGARRAFATIAERVERSLFALHRLSADDWQTARAAYADFALGYRA